MTPETYLSIVQQSKADDGLQPTLATVEIDGNTMRCVEFNGGQPKDWMKRFAAPVHRVISIFDGAQRHRFMCPPDATAPSQPLDPPAPDNVVKLNFEDKPQQPASPEYTHHNYEPPEQPRAKQDAPAKGVARPVVIISSGEFVRGFVPPEYVLVGMLQRRFFYVLTAPTGHGKTAIMLLLAACAALARQFAGKVTKQVRVLYLAAENADDVRMRWIALAQRMSFDLDTIEVYFVEGRFKLSKSLKFLRTEADRIGGEFGLVIVDTGPTFFEGKEENENKQLGDHARLLRSLINAIPGGPCVLAACHPIKNAGPDDLLPRGGGAFLNECDGNLTCWKTDSSFELHWQGKFRGPDFAPINFLIKTVTHQNLKDSDGRLIPTVIAEHISEQAKDEIAAAARANENQVLKLISVNPSLTLSTLATAMGWKLHSGEPNKMRAKRIVDELKRLKLIKETRAGRYKITSDGTKVLCGETEE
jgi:hypothetical protein